MSNIDINTVKRMKKKGYCTTSTTITYDFSTISTRMKNIIKQGFDTLVYKGSWETFSMMKALAESSSVAFPPVLLLRRHWLTFPEMAITPEQHQALLDFKNAQLTIARLEGSAGGIASGYYLQNIDIWFRLCGHKVGGQIYMPHDEKTLTAYVKEHLVPVLSTPETREAAAKLVGMINDGAKFTVTTSDF